MGKRQLVIQILIGMGGAAGLLGAFACAYFLMATPGQPATPVMAAQAHLTRIAAALNAYAADCGRYPTTAEGLEPLLAQPAGAQGWRGPYLDAWWVNADPWGHAIRYIESGDANRQPYRLVSAGPDGKFETRDDISNWPGRAVEINKAINNEKGEGVWG